MAIFWTSDLHFGHRLVANIRGFEDVADHDDAICEAWVEQVKPGDQVWVLGDLAVSNPAHALDLIDALPGEKHLIWGNHDKGHPMHRDSHRKAGAYLKVFASAQAFARKKMNGADVLVSHLPYEGDTDGRAIDRYGEYRLRNMGYPLIHGHTHSKQIVTKAAWGSPGSYGYALQYHVGLDAHAMRLVPAEVIARALSVFSRVPSLAEAAS